MFFEFELRFQFLRDLSVTLLAISVAKRVSRTFCLALRYVWLSFSILAFASEDLVNASRSRLLIVAEIGDDLDDKRHLWGRYCSFFAPSSPEQRTALSLKSLDPLFQFQLRRLEKTRQTRQAHHPFNLPMDEFFVKSNFNLGKLLFVAICTIDLFSSTH